MGVLLDVLLLFVEAAVGELVVEGFEFAGLDTVAFALEEGGHFEFLLGLFEFAAVVGGHLLVEELFALLEGLLVEVAVLLGLLELEGGDADLEDCVAWVGGGVPLRLDDGRIPNRMKFRYNKLQNELVVTDLPHHLLITYPLMHCNSIGLGKKWMGLKRVGEGMGYSNGNRIRCILMQKSLGSMGRMNEIG